MEDISQLIQGNIVSTDYEVDYSCVNVIVVDYLHKFGEVPREPLLQSHAEGVYILIHLLNEGDCLNDGLVLSVHISSALLSGEGVSKT